METGRQSIINRCIENLKDVKPITDAAIWIDIKTLCKDSKEKGYYRYMSVSPAAQRRIINDIRRGIERQQQPDEFGMKTAIREAQTAIDNLLAQLNCITPKS